MFKSAHCGQLLQCALYCVMQIRIKLRETIGCLFRGGDAVFLSFFELTAVAPRRFFWYNEKTTEMMRLLNECGVKEMKAFNKENKTTMDNGADSYRRYLDGDDDGLRVLVEMYSDRLVFFLRGIVGNYETAEDLCADVFALLVVKKPHFREQSAFITWLFQIGRNLAYNELRRQKRKPTEPLDILSEKSYEDVEKKILQTEQKQCVYAALETLHPDYRQVLILLYFENLNYETTAKIMKKNQKQIKNLAYRARQALKTQLEQEGFSDEPF